ncbi:Hydroxymethylglutaryl-CoA synthase A [Galdieria sulphuraria]|nr:Hydroxymethylglutaryl-CoA synthase A [Galdieria sulphuraria]
MLSESMNCNGHEKTLSSGIIGIEVYFPQTVVSLKELEKFDGVSQGKYTIGLGQDNMSFCGDREDVISIAMTVLDSLVSKYGISYGDIGRLEVGTETIIDKSKSVKTALMQLFESCGNTEVEGLDTTNACYGGTQALFNTLYWLESPYWNGKYGVVVMADIAVYAPGPARPTGGCGAVALLLGKGKEVKLIPEVQLRATHMENTYDFFKPNLSSEYPTVDGAKTISCYLRALDTCYSRFIHRAEGLTKQDNFSLQDIDYIVFHAPFHKMVQKSFARLLFNDFKRDPENTFFKDVQQFGNISMEASYSDKDLEKAFVTLSKALYEEKCAPGTFLAKNIGNSYTASLYGNLACLINEKGNDLMNKRIVLFSYGSGLASSMFSLKVIQSVQPIAQKLDMRTRLSSRIWMNPEDFTKTLQLREQRYGQMDYSPSNSIDSLLPGTFYLEQVNSIGCRKYNRK